MSENNENLAKETIPVLPLRDTVVFPKMIVPLFVGREKSIHALQQVNEIGGKVVLVTQKKASTEDPKSDDIYTIGTLGNILQMLKLPDGTVKVLIEGIERIKIKEFFDNGKFISADIEPLPESQMDEREIEVLSRTVISSFEEYVKVSRKLSPDVLVAVRQIEDYSKLSDTIASHITLKTEEKQQLLESE
ncbi:MAG: LON peptidase substrate-binding domain-containing protein, partial [Alphaproteobacteria bacterium]|nr:LON peptidase substrate-binding domain-containing protein [Alphaproteobacteria bacterium]